MSHNSADAELLTTAVRTVGAFVLDQQKTARESYKKKGGEPVTETDLQADHMLRDLLTSDRPDYGWLSEEYVDDLRRLDCSRTWIVDPIDGTRAFLRGASDFVISAALVRNQQPVIGAVFAPAREEFYHAEKGRGAWKNGRPVRVSPVDELVKARAIAVQGFLRSKKRWKEPWPVVAAVDFNSIALRICLVSDGRFDFAITSRKKKDWDLAAADLILSEAGGLLFDPEGHAFRYNLEDTHKGPVIASCANLAPAILDFYSRARTA